VGFSEKITACVRCLYGCCGGSDGGGVSDVDLEGRGSVGDGDGFEDGDGGLAVGNVVEAEEDAVYWRGEGNIAGEFNAEAVVYSCEEFSFELGILKEEIACL
jgi:hypothetical protein